MDRYRVRILDSDSTGITSAGRGSPRHYPAQRGSDADENGSQDRKQQGFCGNKCECPADYAVVRKEILQHREQHRPTAGLYSPYKGFIRGHCGKVATKAPPGREIGASAQAAIHPQPRAVPTKTVHSQYQAAPCSLPSLAGLCLHITASACGDGQWPLFCRTHPQAIAGMSCLLQRRCNHTLIRPYGHVGLRGSIPQPRKIRVASDQALSGRFGGCAP
jgi:hypothetical protein